MKIVITAVYFVVLIGEATVFITNLALSKSSDPAVRKGKFINALIDGIGLAFVIGIGLAEVFPFLK